MAPSRAPFVCSTCLRALRSQSSTQQVRAFSATVAQNAAPATDLPRWQQTPPAMKMPFRVRPRKEGVPMWRVNNKPEPVDEMYDRFVGRVGEAARGQEGLKGTRGRELLDEEVKV
jgi:large subunit ribosomal protein L15